MSNFPFGVSEDDHFSIIEKYFLEKGLVYTQYEGYEYLINNYMQKIFDECNSIEIETKNSMYRATFGQIYFEKASIIDENRLIKNITPNEARLRDITYDSPIFVDILEEFYENEKLVNQINHSKIFLFRVPTMVKSSRCNLYKLTNKECIEKGECDNDPGGYFIINGKERALICQERLNYNQVYLFDSNSEKFPFIAEIRSMSEETGHSVLLKATIDKDFRNCCFSLPYMSKEVLAGTVFKALGFNNKDIVRFINPSSKEEIKYTERLIRESIMYNTKEKAIKYISKSTIQKVEDNEERRIQYTIQVIENELFPHMGISTNLEKAILLGTMINKLFRVCLGKRKKEDRDNISIKRIEGPGILVGELIRMCLKRYRDNLKKYLEKRQDIITAISRTNSITQSIKSPFATGNWTAQKNTYVRTGVSQLMSRLTYPATISHLRRIIIPIGKEGKNVKVRQIHPTQCFFVDIIESPEGKGIGIVKNFALLSRLTVGCNSVLVKKIVESCNNIKNVSHYFDVYDTSIWDLIYVNGTLVGITDKIDELYNELTKMKYEDDLFNEQVSFSKNKEEKELRIFCDHGRFIRPLINVENNRLVLKKEDISLSWKDLTDKNIIRYIDSNEVENSLIAMYPLDLLQYSDQVYNYCEIHPSTMLGVCSSVIPYSEHNQNPRLVYEASMMKQALGIYALSYQQRFDTISHIMHYPQKPLVETKYNKMLNYDEMLTGCNPIVAISPYTGFGQEDSVILNKSSIERGMFMTTAFKTLVFEEKKKTNCSYEKIEIPPLKIQNKIMNYSKLGSDGIIKKGVPVYKGDIIIGKTLTKVQKDDEDEKIDYSLSISSGEEGIIDDIWRGLCEEGYVMVKIKIRQLRFPEIGDKFASRSSQKGVCGLLLPQEDMPFSNQGITPDLLMNPHSMPSRMTLSQLIECLYSKSGSLEGTFGDSTAFTEQSINPVENIANMLKKHGFHKYGNEKLYNGFTGEFLDSEIFIGPTYYQRLKHMVQDKIHCLTLDHEVLTLSGWKMISEITTNDKVATLNKNGELEYQNPVNIYDYPEYEGSMYYIKNQSIDLAVTGNHRMWVSKLYGRKKNWLSFDFERADKLVGKIVKYKKDAEWIKEDYQFIIPSIIKYVNIIMEEKIIDMNSWLVFWGIWIAEGWTSGSSTSGRITISIDKQRVKDALYPSLDKMNIKYHIDKDCKKLNIYDNQLYMYMKTFSVGAPLKKLPEWVFNLSKNQTRILLESMILGDGSIAKNGCKFYYTSSKFLADQFQQLCLHAGWSSILSTHIKANNSVIIDGRSVTSNHDILRLSIITKRLSPSVNHGHVKNQSIQKEIYIENEKIHVACIEVPNQIFYVRRNGKSVWTANSRSTGNVTMMHHQPSEGRSREGGLRVGEMERDALIGHGGAAFIQETLFDMSDQYQVNVCEECGNILSSDKACRICKNGQINRTNIPYCAKLLFQELEAMGIKIQINTK